MLQLHVYTLLTAVALQSAADWVVLDEGYVTRQGDRATLTRQGPWAQFTQRFVRIEDGRPAGAGTVERLGVNCLTGAFGAVHVSMNEIEHRQVDGDRLLLSDNSSELGGAIIGFACNCPAPVAAPATPTDAHMHALYDRYMAEPMSKIEFQLSFLRVKSRALADRLVGELKAGRPFASVFDQYASPLDARTFVHGRLGTTQETDLPANIVAALNRLQVGEISAPQDQIYGWEIYKVEAKRILPAPSFETMLPRLKEYVRRAQACGWKD